MNLKKFIVLSLDCLHPEIQSPVIAIEKIHKVKA